MLVILTVFFYIDSCLAFSSLYKTDNGLFGVRCKVQIPAIMSVINRSNAGNKLFNNAFVDLGA